MLQYLLVVFRKPYVLIIIPRLLGRFYFKDFFFLIQIVGNLCSEC